MPVSAELPDHRDTRCSGTWGTRQEGQPQTRFPSEEGGPGAPTLSPGGRGARGGGDSAKAAGPAAWRAAF